MSVMFCGSLSMIPCATLLNTSVMIHHFGVSLNKQHTAGLLICGGGRQRTRIVQRRREE